MMINLKYKQLSKGEYVVWFEDITVEELKDLADENGDELEVDFDSNMIFFKK